MVGAVLRIRQEGISWREVNGEVIALDLESSAYFVSNKSGTLMWRALVDGTTPERLADLLSAEYGLPASMAAVDVRAFITLLRQHNLLTDVQ